MNISPMALDELMQNGNLHIDSNCAANTVEALAGIAKQFGTHLTVNGKHHSATTLLNVVNNGGKNVTIII